MRETRSDTRRALLEAVGLHAVLFALMFAGLQWTRDPSIDVAAGEPIEAELVDPDALSTSMQRALQRDAEPLPEPVPEPEPVDAPLPAPVPEDTPAPVEPPPPVPDPAPVEQERVQRAPAPQVAQVPREQEERRKRPEQADLDAQRQQQAERERQQQIEALRRQREQAARERTQAEMRAEQLADARNAAPTPPRGNPNSASNQSAYGVAIQIAVERQWLRPDSIRQGQRCQVLIVQIPGGEVVDVQVSANCPYDELGRRSLEAAILKASPLPYAGFEDVFQRRLVLNFQPSD